MIATRTARLRRLLTQQQINDRCRALFVPVILLMSVCASANCGSAEDRGGTRSNGRHGDHSVVLQISDKQLRPASQLKTESTDRLSTPSEGKKDRVRLRNRDDDQASTTEEAEWTQTEFQVPPSLAALQSLETTPIDLACAFGLIGVQNPQFLAAQQRVLEAEALRQLAAVQLLPTINLGTSFDSHAGVLQQSNGNLLTVNRQSLFVGAGASAIAAGTVNVPGVLWNLNATETYFNYLISRQVQAQRAVNVTTVNNTVQLEVATAYLELMRAAGQRSIATQARQDFAEVARITAVFARAGQGRPADANRAVSELHARDSDLIDAEGQIVATSARLASLVGLDTAVKLVPVDTWAVPHSIVPEPVPLRELLTIAVLRRPELEEQRLEFCRTLLALQSAKMLPFSPTVFLGLSAGAFGGGSDLATQPVGTSAFASGQERFGNFQSRGDLDAMVYWSLRNLGVGNRAMVAASGSRVRQSQWQQMIVLDRVRAEVATAYIRVHARYRQLETAEQAVRESEIAWTEDLQRIRGNEGLPIEVLDSQRLLVKSRQALLNTIINYNIAQFELYFALGQPPAELLVRPAVDEESVEKLLPRPAE
jgi:outer membrane protein TolC